MLDSATTPMLQLLSRFTIAMWGAGLEVGMLSYADRVGRAGTAPADRELAVITSLTPEYKALEESSNACELLRAMYSGSLPPKFESNLGAAGLKPLYEV